MRTSLKDLVNSSAATSTLTPRPQPVCLEVPVTVNGVRTAQGNDKREPFTENTRTVIVFSNGAVLRLSAALAPGQLIFLVNERTKKEIVCQVVKSKNYRNVSGYVEVEFTEPSVGFWGMRFPGDKIGPVSSAAQEGNPAARTGAASEPERIAKSVPASAPVERPQVAASFLASSEAAGEFPRAVEASPAETGITSDPFPAALAAPPKTELPAAPPAAKPPVSIGSGAESAALPASSKTKIQPHEEAEVLPVWLTPSAYSSLAAPVRPPTADSLAKSIAELAATIEANTPKKRAPAPLPDEATNLVMSRSDASEFQGEVFSSPAPAFAEEQAPTNARPGRGRGLLYGAIAATALVSLGGGGWWFVQNSQNHTSQAVAATPAAQAPVPRAAAPATNLVPASPAAISASAAAQPAPEPVASKPAETLKPAPVSLSARVQPAPSAEKNERVVPPAKKESNKDSNAPLKTPPSPKPAATEQTKKTAMPKLQLAAPIVVHNATQSGASPELNLNSMPGVPTGTDVSGMMASSGSQPAAPKPETVVGGDAQPAKISFSVAPVYPVLAQKQHLGGSVVLSAEILPDGRVGAVKIISGLMLLRQAAVDAVKQWKYQPAMLDGKAVASQVSVTLQFRAQ